MFDGCNLVSAEFKGADLFATTFFESNLSGNVFHGANFTKVNLGKSNFTYTSLNKANFDIQCSAVETNFSNADMRDIYIFTPVDFSKANFTDTDLRGAYLLNCDFTDAIFNRTAIDSSTKIDLKKQLTAKQRKGIWRF